jgi:hypothetical protein
MVPLARIALELALTSFRYMVPGHLKCLSDTEILLLLIFSRFQNIVLIALAQAL